MRLQVNVADEMVTRIDDIASQMGVSRSALCSVAIGQYIMSLDKTMDILNALGEKVGDSLLTEKILKK